MAILFALAASITNAFATILQRLGVQHAPDDTSFSWQLVMHALRQPVWLAGTATMTGGYVLQFLALSYAGLSVVEPVLTLELVFLVAILGIWFNQTLGWQDWVGAMAITVGLGGFLYAASPSGGNSIPASLSWIEAFVVVLAAASVTALLAARGGPWWRASLLGVSSALFFSLAAASTKVATAYLKSGGWLSLLTHWQTYGIAIAGGAGLFVLQHAYRAGPITASQSALMIVDPLASILIGVSLFDERVRSSGARGPLEALALLGMFSGVILLSKSPVVVEAKAAAEGISLDSPPARKAAH